MTCGSRKHVCWTCQSVREARQICAGGLRFGTPTEACEFSLTTFNIEDTTSNPRASGAVPAHFQRGNFQHSRSIAENNTGFYVSADPASTSSEIHRAVSAIDRSCQASGSNFYHRSQLLGPDQSTLGPTQGYSYQPEAHGVQQTLVTAALNFE